MNKKIIPFLALLLLSLILQVSAVGREPGVGVGDFCEYHDIVFYFSSTEPNATLPPGYEEINETLWMYMQVTDVSGTNVTGQATIHYKNGTEETSEGWVDVDTGDGENMTMFLLAKDLGPGDSLYTSGYYSSWKINETISKTYPSGEVRDTNHLNLTMEMSFTYYARYSMNYYWDKETGVVVQMDMEIIERNTYNTTMSMHIGITGTNRWVVPEFSAWTLLLTLTLSFAVITVIIKRRRLKIQN